MLKKLLKYDLKNIYKVLIIFYSLGIVFAILTRIFFSIENSVLMDIIAKILSGVTISMIINIIINNLMGLWARFRRNFYKDESYLTHTLPISKGTLYLSKVLASIITLFTSVFVIGLILFIAYYSKENMEILKSLILPMLEIYNSTLIIFILVTLFILFLEFLNAVLSGFTGIILGHKRNSNKVAFSALYGFLCYMLTQVFIVALLFIYGLFNSEVMNLFHTTSQIDIATVKLIVLFSCISYSLILCILYFINNKLFKKGVNVD